MDRLEKLYQVIINEPSELKYEPPLTDKEKRVLNRFKTVGFDDLERIEYETCFEVTRHWKNINGILKKSSNNLPKSVAFLLPAKVYTDKSGQSDYDYVGNEELLPRGFIVEARSRKEEY